MEIDVALKGTGSGTELLALFNVAGEGQLKPVVDRLFERRATERAAQFADCLAKRFGADSSGEAEVQRGDRPLAERAWIGRMTQWLRRLWRRFLGQTSPPGR
jgi:hypothetical protein